MPEIIIHAAAGRSAEQKRGLVKDITDAVVKHYNVPADAVAIQIVGVSLDSKAKGGVLFSDRT